MVYKLSLIKVYRRCYEVYLANESVWWEALKTTSPPLPLPKAQTDELIVRKIKPVYHDFTILI